MESKISNQDQNQNLHKSIGKMEFRLSSKHEASNNLAMILCSFYDGYTFIQKAVFNFFSMSFRMICKLIKEDTEKMGTLPEKLIPFRSMANFRKSLVRDSIRMVRSQYYKSGKVMCIALLKFGPNHT